MLVNTFRKDKDAGKKIFIFLLSPIVSFLYCLKDFRSKSSYIIFFLFALFFGFAFEVEKAESLDGYRYRELFRWISTGKYDIWRNFVDWLSFRSEDKDFYLQVVCYIVSLFTSNYHFLFLLLALVFVFFQLSSLKFLTDSRGCKNDLYGLCLVLIFVGSNQIFNINGARFWTASWAAVFTIFQLLYVDNKKYYVLLFLLPFFHAAFMIFPVLYMIYFISKKWGRLWLVLFVVSFFFANISTLLFRDFSNYLPETLQFFNDRYTDAEALEDYEEKQKSFSMLYLLTKNLSMIYIGALIFLISSYIKKTEKKFIYNIYIFTMVLSTFSNFTMSIPSLGGRFAALVYPFIAFLSINVLPKQKYALLIYFAPFAMVNQLYQYIIHYNMVLPMPDFLLTPFIVIIKHLII